MSPTIKALLPWLEAIAAIAISIFGYTAILFFDVGSFERLFAPNVFLYVAFYASKCAIAYQFRSNKEGACILYGIALLPVAVPFLRSFDSWDLLIRTFFWCVVPTITFGIDLASKSTVRMMVWRSALEIVILNFLWCFCVAIILVIVMAVMGVWPFA